MPDDDQKEHQPDEEQGEKTGSPDDARVVAVAEGEPPGADEEAKPGGVEGPEEPATAETTDGDGGDDGEDTVSVRDVNRLVLGELTLHYPARDVALVLDGEAAIRILTMFWRRRPGSLADRLDPETSSALSGWVVLDLGEPLAVSWFPTLGARPRTAIDPAVPQAA